MEPSLIGSVLMKAYPFLLVEAVPDWLVWVFVMLFLDLFLFCALFGRDRHTVPPADQVYQVTLHDGEQQSRAERLPGRQKRSNKAAPQPLEGGPLVIIGQCGYQGARPDREDLLADQV